MSWSLSQEKNYVADALDAVLAPTADYVPEQTVLERLTFLSSARIGANAAAQPVGPNQVRATVPVSVVVKADDTGEGRPISKALALYGPGDVVGFDPQQVIRCEPPDGAAVPWGGTLAHIEFDDPTLPWAFSLPLAGEPDTRLRPWIALVVVEQRAGQLSAGAGGLPPQLTAGVAELFPQGDVGGWAHVQVMTGQGDAVSLDDRLTDAHGDLNLSRLICPRRLQPRRRYLACVVPTTGIGRTTGCGISPPAGPEGAWNLAAGGQVTLPVYYHWSFETLDYVDFEGMVGKLQPVAAPAGVGRRLVDTSRPGGGLPAAVADQGAVQRMECALYSPLATPATAQSWGNQAWKQERTQLLRNAVNRSLDAQANAKLPRVSPRAYGQFQRGGGKIPPGGGGWFDELNCDPLRRIAAGLGTRVVQKDADLLVEAAWSQAGKVTDVNIVVDASQFGEWVTERVVKKGEERMGLEALVAITDRVQSKLGWGASPATGAARPTLAGEIAASATPRAATTAAYRRMTSAVGRVARTAARISGNATPFATMTTDLPGLGATRLADMRRAYTRPDGIGGFSAATLKRLPVDQLAKATGFNPAGRLTGGVPAIDRLGQVAVGAPDLSLDVGQITAGFRLDAVKRVLLDAGTVTPGMREALGGLLATAAPAIAPAQAAELTQQMELLHAAVPEPAAPPAPTPPTPTPVPGPGRRPIDLRPGPINVGRIIGVPPVRGGSPIVGRIDPNVFRTIPLPVQRTALQRFTAFNAGRASVPIGRGTVAGAQLLAALKETARGTIGDLAGVPARGAARVTRGALLAATDPRQVCLRYLAARLDLGGRYKGWFNGGSIQPLVVDGPRFDRPMFEALRDYDRDWLVPGLGQIKGTDFVTLLVANARFAESFMVGLSDELGRELLWRGYPVDRRATFFGRFWNPVADDIAPGIRSWQPQSSLGQHSVPPPPAGPVPADGSADRVVLMIRGEVVRTFPDLIVLAQQGSGKDPTPFAAPPATGAGSLLFRAKLDPDTLVVGFDLTVAQIKAPAGAPWWFLLAEHPGAPRFGLDRDDGRSDTGYQKTDPNFDALEWGELPLSGEALTFGPGPKVPAIWGTDSAANAQVLLQSPVRAAFEAAKLVAKIQGAG